jgi:hypothetical protein
VNNFGRLYFAAFEGNRTVTMKRVALFFTTAAFVAILAISCASAQDAPLGDLARQVRKQKPAPTNKTFDNDNLPKDDKVSVVGQTPEQSSDGNPQDANNGAAQPADPAAQPAADAGKAGNGEQKSSTDEEQQKKLALWKEWQNKIKQQRDAIDLANRELDVANREYRLRAAAFYADAGNRLRNSTEWDKEDSQYKDQIAAKQKTVDDAKKKLEDMQDEARKAGVPSSMRDGD